MEWLKKACPLVEVQGGCPYIDMGIGGGSPIISFALDPHRDKLLEMHPSTIERRLRVMKKLVLGLFERFRLLRPKHEILLPHTGRRPL